MRAPAMEARHLAKKNRLSTHRYSYNIKSRSDVAVLKLLSTMKAKPKPTGGATENGSSVPCVGEEAKSPYPFVLERRQPNDVDAELLAHLDEVRRLARQSMCQQEDQRRQVSRELHDNIAQILCAATNRISLAQDHQIPAWLQQELQDLREHLETALEEVRALARNLRPQLLDAAGFDSALEKHVRQMRERSGITIVVKASPAIGMRFGRHKLTHLFRLIQEALQNVEDHSDASKAHIFLTKSGDMVCLEVADNGCSFTPARIVEAQQTGHLGLLGMRERAELLGGSLSVEAKPGVGTTIKVFMPLQGISV